MTTTWTIAVDWNRDGDFTDTYDDVTDYVIAANWFLGLRKPYHDAADDSMLKLTLNNSDKRFSPENTVSPLYDSGAGKTLITPFKLVRVQSDDGVDDPRIHWIGWIESIEPAVNKNGQRQVTITAAGPMQFFKAAETTLPLQENQRTDQIIAELIKEVVIPPALNSAWILERVGNSEVGTTTFLANTQSYSDLEAGITTLSIAADNWVRQGGRSDETEDTFNVYRAIMDVVAAERGRFYFSRDGKATFWNRHHLLQDTDDEVAAAMGLGELPTFNDTMQGLDYSYAGLEDFKNEIVVMCHPRTISASSNEILWQLADEIRVAPGQTRTLSAKFQDDSGNRIGGKNVTVDGVAFSVGSASITLNDRANSAELEIINNGTVEAVLTALIIRGQKITDFGQMEAKVSDTASIVDYGRRTMKLNLTAVDNFDDAEGIAQFELGRRSQPRGAVRSMTLKSQGLLGGGPHDEQLVLTIGDRIIIEETQTEHADTYTIIGEAYRLSEGATLLETTWYLELAADSFPWKLDDSQRSKLDNTTVLTY